MTSETKGTVGIIGLGIMGSAYAKNLLDAGFGVVGTGMRLTARKRAFVLVDAVVRLILVRCHTDRAVRVRFVVRVHDVIAVDKIQIGRER